MIERNVNYAMKISTGTSFPKSLRALVLVIPENGSTQLGILSKGAAKIVSSEISRRKLKGAPGEAAVIRTGLVGPEGHVIVIGGGKDADSETWRSVTAAAIKTATEHALTSVGMDLPKASTAEFTRAIAGSAHLASYRYTKHHSKATQTRETLLYLRTTSGKLNDTKQAIQAGVIEAEATILARDLVNEPPSLLTPRNLAAEAKRIGRAGGLTATVLSKKQMERLGFHATLAVAKGSNEEPCFIKLSYSPRSTRKHVVLVGKGVTYDAGGINIKPSRGGSLEDMKMDMAGAAAVMATLSALPKLKLPVKVTAYVAATENLLGGSAYKPGDVVRAYNGKSIEITNTDAEGRLTLADALSYAIAKDKPDTIIDLATLTGAAIVALGDKIAALFSNNDELSRALWKASKQSGERIWKMPLPHDYNEMIKGRIADLDNSGASGAGTITAALFLQNFVGNTPWAHLDIAGPAFSSKESGYLARGGTGFGVRLLLEYLGSIK